SQESREQRVSTILSQALMNRLPFGVFVVGANCEVIRMNPAAQQVLAGANVLELRGRRLAARGAVLNQRLMRLICEAVRSALGGGSEDDRMLVLPAGTLEESLVVQTTPLRGR